jgi:hypothetical protein
MGTRHVNYVFTLFGQYWLVAYALLLPLAILKEQKTIGMLQSDVGQQKRLLADPRGVSVAGVSAPLAARCLSECESALQHERDLSWIEGGLSIFLFATFVIYEIAPWLSLPAQEARGVLITAELVVLFYVATFLALKMQRFWPLIDLASKSNQPRD